MPNWSRKWHANLTKMSRGGEITKATLPRWRMARLKNNRIKRCPAAPSHSTLVYDAAEAGKKFEGKNPAQRQFIPQSRPAPLRLSGLASLSRVNSLHGIKAAKSAAATWVGPRTPPPPIVNFWLEAFGGSVAATCPHRTGGFVRERPAMGRQIPIAARSS